MKTELFDYHLPPERIAQTPVEPRDASRLMVLHRTAGTWEHRQFHEIGEYLVAGDLLVANNSRVIPARLSAQKPTGGQAEVFLLEPVGESLHSSNPELGALWRCLVRGRNLRPGTTLSIVPQAEEIKAAGVSTELGTDHSNTHPNTITATIEAEETAGVRVIRFSQPVATFVEEFGTVPLPPYITDYHGDPERYQTVYSQSAGSVAAPTAGLHFTPELLLTLRSQGVQFESATLHVGLDTFRPIEVEDAAQHPIHSERAELTARTAQTINQTSLSGGRIIAVGTTAVRTLEWAAHQAAGAAFPSPDPAHPDQAAPASACPWQRVSSFSGSVNLFIRPGYTYRAVDALITNFHLPRSTLLMLVSAFAAQAYPHDVDMGRQLILAAYTEAINQGYRFYSFGDAMLIL